MRKCLGALAVCCCWSTGNVHAQVSGSVAFVSDYLYRGLSSSDGRPVAQLNLAYDAEAGWFTGAFASRIRDAADLWGSVQYIGYAGYARRIEGELSWESGIARHHYAGASGRDYNEVHLGINSGQYSARISYAPNYLGMQSRTVYLEGSAGRELMDGLSGFVHLGYLNYLHGSPAYIARYRIDGRIGVVKALAGWKVQLAWDAAHISRTPVVQYGGNPVRSRNGVVLNLTRPF